MKKQKLTYSAPTTETLVVRFEENVLQTASSKYGALNAAGMSFSSTQGNIIDYTGEDF